MNRLQINTLLIFLTLSICIGGCGKNENEPPEPEPPQDTVRPLCNIRFDTITTERFKEILEGRWKMIACRDSLNLYVHDYEFKGDEYIKFYNNTFYIEINSNFHSYSIYSFGERWFPHDSFGYRYFVLNQYYYITDEYWTQKCEATFYTAGIFDCEMKITAYDIGDTISRTFTLIKEEE